ncbi:XRE family transcriptional regulator [Verminephrobacter eiseniae]|nr:XRE family transcriptional regulator [Verminephrobacter eiseniae]
MTKIEAFDSVWDAVADTSGQAASLRARAEPMRQIAAVIEGNDWTPSAAAMHCGVAQPRSDDLLRGRVSRFCLNALVNSATAMGRRVHMELQAA